MRHIEPKIVVICFQFSIFEISETTTAFKTAFAHIVVICFQFSIFEISETTIFYARSLYVRCDLLSI